MLLAEPDAHTTVSPVLQRARGDGRLSIVARDGRSHLARLYQDGCAKIRLPKTHTNALEGVLINTAGGLTAGDRLDWSVDAGAGTRTVVTTQACERVYRCEGGGASIATRLTAGPGARLDWLPQETILFDRARLDRTMEIDLAGDAVFCGLEAVILGREAMGEDAAGASLADRWRIRRDGRLVHAEANRLDASDLARSGLSLLAGARAFATLVYLGPDAESRIDGVRAILPESAHAAASAGGGRLVVRALAPSGLALRRILAPLVANLSSAGSLPRLWTI